MTPAPQPVFRALADSTRRDILLMLRDREMTIAEVAANFNMTRAAVKKHLSMVSDGYLITVRAQGRERINAFNPQGMAPLLDWLTFFDAFMATPPDTPCGMPTAAIYL